MVRKLIKKDRRTSTRIEAVLYDGSIESKEVILKLEKGPIFLLEKKNKLTIRTLDSITEVEKGHYVIKEDGFDELYGCDEYFFNSMFK